MEMFLFVLLLLIFSSLLFGYFHLKNVTHGATYFPEPPGHFFFGQIFQLNSLSDVINFLSGVIKFHGKNVMFRLGLAAFPIKRGIVTTDHKLMQLILNSSHILTKSENYRFLKSWLGNGLLLSDGEHWRRHRKMLTPAFHFAILKNFVATFEKVGNKLIDSLKNYDGSVSFDLHNLVSLCTLDIICETAMGTKIDAQNNENTPYVNGVREMCQLTIARALSLLKIFDTTYWLTKDYYVSKKILNILHSFTLNVINSRRRNKEEIKNTKMAFLDLLLLFSDDQGKGLTLNEIREETDTFMFEGHDTVSVGICYTLFCLAEYPEIQDKVFQEQRNLFGNETNPNITYTELQNMKYLENVIKESLRLYPPVPVVGRYLYEDIYFDGRLIPRNTNIVLWIYGIHRDPDYFPEPENFDPERFQNCDNLVPFSYIPFSAGPRNCIGQKFAMLEMKSIISKVIRHFEVRPANPRHTLQLSVEAVLKSNSGIKVGLKKRE